MDRCPQNDGEPAFAQETRLVLEDPLAGIVIETKEKTPKKSLRFILLGTKLVQRNGTEKSLGESVGLAYIHEIGHETILISS